MKHPKTTGKPFLCSCKYNYKAKWVPFTKKEPNKVIDGQIHYGYTSMGYTLTCTKCNKPMSKQKVF